MGHCLSPFLFDLYHILMYYVYMTNLPILYTLTSTGAIQQWSVRVSGNQVVTEYGHVDGKKQTTYDTIKGKNIGKVNETTDIEQAKLKAKQLYDKKVKEGYVTDINQAAKGESDLGGIDPMLAFPIEDKPKYVSYPAWAQPKLDGFRCVAIIKKGEVKLFSRTRKLITTLPHINQQLKEAFGNKNIILDGELYNHELKEDFPRLAGIIKRDEEHKDSVLIQYHIYDVVVKDNWEARITMAHDALDNKSKHNIKLVESKLVYSKEEMEEQFSNYLQDGYEGLMLRSLKGDYEHKRSPTLLKVKVMSDAEFKVIGVEEGNGKLQGKAGALICLTKEGKEFKVKMKGALDSLTEYLVNFDKYKGRELTVQFHDLSPDGIPRFPVGIRFREDI